MGPEEHAAGGISKGVAYSRGHHLVLRELRIPKDVAFSTNTLLLQKQHGIKWWCHYQGRTYGRLSENYAK